MPSFMFSNIPSSLNLSLRVVHISADSVGLIILFTVPADSYQILFLHEFYIIFHHDSCFCHFMNPGVSKCIFPDIIHSYICWVPRESHQPGSILNQKFGSVIFKPQRSIYFGPHSCEKCLGAKNFSEVTGPSNPSGKRQDSFLSLWGGLQSSYSFTEGAALWNLAPMKGFGVMHPACMHTASVFYPPRASR